MSKSTETPWIVRSGGVTYIGEMYMHDDEPDILHLVINGHDLAVRRKDDPEFFDQCRNYLQYEGKRR